MTSTCPFCTEPIGPNERTCHRCGNVLPPPPAPMRVQPPPPGTQGDAAFDRDRFLLRQKHLSISEKYYVWDDMGRVLLFIERPRHLLRNVAAIFGGFLIGGITGGLLIWLATAMSSGPIQLAMGVAGFLAFIFISLILSVALSRKRDLKVYRDDTKRELLLQVLQENKFTILHAYYTVTDAAGEILARFDKNLLFDIFRRRWYCRRPNGQLMCLAKEDSLALALLRRLFGPMFGLLRINFIIIDPTTETVIGEFNRKLTILDRYVLDLTRDRNRSIDRRVALALGVMLDTGERR